MKEVVYLITALILLANASADLTDAPRADLVAPEISCNSTGSLTLNITHSGINIFTKDISLAAVHIESNTTVNLAGKGVWANGFGSSNEINQSGSDFSGATSTLRFFSDPLLTSSGEYQLKISWPGGLQPWQNRLVVAFDCPGIECASDGQCDSSQRCVEGGRCAYLSCSGCDAAVNHKCTSKCDDGNPCTQDACDENGDCLHVSAPDCCRYDSDCYDSNNCTTDKCISGKCSNNPTRCPATIDPCAVGKCTAGGGCVYSTDYRCQQWSKFSFFRLWHWFTGLFA